MGKKLPLILSLILFFNGLLHGQVPPPPIPICSLQVVFHILHQNGPENIGDSQIVDAMRILNEDFSKTNADTIDIIPQFQHIAADSRSRFRLATIDPQGHATTGIDRIVTALTDSADDNSKINQWPPDKYVNIWVVKNQRSSVTFDLAYLPMEIGQVGSQYDGVTIPFDRVGTEGQSLPSFAHVLTHGMGHYFGLYHPWGGASRQFNNGPGIACGNDSIADTPETRGWDHCPQDTNVAKICHPKYQNGPSDSGVVENYQNFMEYSYCFNMFTAGQCLKMLHVLQDTIAHRDQLCGAIGVGIEELPAIANEVTLYPNPATANVQVAYQLANESFVKIEVYDALGSTIKTLPESKEQTGYHSLTIDTKALPQGVYVVRLTADGVAVCRRLVVAK